MIDGKRFVTDVYDGSPAASAGVKQGDEILSADGVPFQEIESFRGKIGKSVDLALRRAADQAPITIPVPVAPVAAVGDAGLGDLQQRGNRRARRAPDRLPAHLVLRR